jgi:hypothetical protein
MAKLDDVFPSNYLKVDDLKGRKVSVTIDRVEIEKVGTDNKPVAYFKETNKSFTLNKTNARMIAMLVGSDDTDDWRGRRITLRPDMTTFQGKPTPCIRVDSELPGQPQPPPPPVQEADEIPF